jgi:hypothetical protein
MEETRKSRMALVATFLLVAAVPVAGASITFNLTSSLLVANPGETVSFFGIITNTGSATAFLSGDSFTFPLVVDDMPFLVNVPPSLAPGASFAGGIFDAVVPPATPFGTYTGVFNVLGGDAPSDSAVLASSDFGVTVVPEPATWSGALGGILAAALMRYRRRRREAIAQRPDLELRSVPFGWRPSQDNE